MRTVPRHIFIALSPVPDLGGEGVGIVVGVNTRRGVGFRHESSVNERVFRPYRKRGGPR